jgi:CheY-like chemotaxis protein
MDSTPGVGSEFSVTLEFELASPEAIAHLENHPAEAGRFALRDVRVLVVDDSDINLDVTKRILESEGARVSLANDGQQAVDLLQADPGAIDVVLMDVQMPVLDGHDATRRIRGELGLENLPIIALTAGALSSERQRASEAGMDDYIAKPFDAPSLVRSILRHVQPAADASARDAEAASKATARARARATPWPEIDGIDSSDARERMSNDFDLFRSMLRRLLGEFADVALPAPTGDSDGFALHAGRMHKLRGQRGHARGQGDPAARG